MSLKDFNILLRVVQVLQDTMNAKVEDDKYQSSLLFAVILFSEMWEMPSPSVASIKKQFTDVLMSDNGIYVTTELYCAFSKEKSKTCNTFQTGKYDADPISYERDEYWNKRAVIPTQASVLLLSSKLDAQAPYKHAELLLDALKGDNKELIAFEHASHSAIMSTPLIPGDPESPICGMELLVSYIKNGGNLKKMDRSCVKKMPPFNMTITTEYLNGYLLTDDAYDGVYNETAGTSDIKPRNFSRMRFYHAILLAAVAVSPITAKSKKASIQWKSCPQYTVTSETPASSGSESPSEDAECAVYNAPLCYPGVCETPEGVDSTIEVFVKRYPATVGNPKTARNVWLLQGGPGISSVSSESTTIDLQKKLGGSFNMYLMDHRGTGRSTRLSCSAETKLQSSCWGSDIEASNVGKCAKELANKYGDMSSFSTTSAAKDVATFMGEHTNGEDTVVYGLSYGTMLGERLMHLDPPEVTGYVLDSITTSSGARATEFPYCSNWDTNFGEVADQFLVMSQEDEEITARFKKRGLVGTIKHLIAKFDKDPDSVCAVISSMVYNNTDSTGTGLTSVGMETDPPSFALRRALGILLTDSEMRKFIPPFVYRLNRCDEKKDLEILLRVIQVLQDTMNAKVEDDKYQSSLLFAVILFSEMWEMPSPSVASIKKQFTDVLMSKNGIYVTTELYCAFSKEKSKTCNTFQTGKYDADPISYERDEYWNKRAVIPTQASVLLLSSKLDAQAPYKHAELLLDALKGDNKELIAFEHASHSAIMSTPLIPGDPESPICGMELLVSYIKNGGNLKKMDRSCVKKMPSFNMTITTEYLNGYLLTDDAYDGVYNESLYYQAVGEQAAVSPITAKSNNTSIQWKSCPQYTVTSETLAGSGSDSQTEDAECTTYNAPLCYPGLCETPEGIDSIIEVFVKRYPATVGNPKTARNVWLLQGGPGISSVSLESTAVDLQKKVGGGVNM
ncbi:hypothetical protein P3T76_006878 [Phytophthora citrophthora]|uniref:AB hydrolase-1 domain-containing protein n=1 Tax=Phytophthora citrophthora TaxID=4793 RepID=A0AAD9LP78_9STRA|nr:hypothetical protein P3T76_006878 [Phytophthora citrophthora]